MAAPYIHATAIVDKPHNIGDDTKIWHWVHVMPGAQIGSRCVLGQNVFIGSKARLGNNVHVQNNVSVYDNVILEDDVFCGPSLVFTNVKNPRSHINRKDEYKETVVKKGATLGANATIVCGVTIGAYAMVGAGAVVTKNIPDYAMYIGIPAQQAGWVSKNGHPLTFEEDNSANCPDSGEEYLLQGDRVIPKNQV